jgi:hypothetical protein
MRTQGDADEKSSTSLAGLAHVASDSGWRPIEPSSNFADPEIFLEVPKQELDALQ